MNKQEALSAMTRGNHELDQSVHDMLNRTRLVRSLIRIRAQAGLSQAEVAKKMNCSQSRVSKIEHGLDDDISIGELNAYTKAVGCWFEISISNTNRNATGMIKHHILLANELLKRIIRLSDNDKAMLDGADQVSMEMLVNFCRLLDDATQKIPNSSFQKIIKQVRPRVSNSFELNCNELIEKELVKA